MRLRVRAMWADLCEFKQTAVMSMEVVCWCCSQPLCVQTASSSRCLKCAGNYFQARKKSAWDQQRHQDLVCGTAANSKYEIAWFSLPFYSHSYVSYMTIINSTWKNTMAVSICLKNCILWGCCLLLWIDVYDVIKYAIWLLVKINHYNVEYKQQDRRQSQFYDLTIIVTLLLITIYL